MKTISRLFIACLFFTSIGSNAQTVDEIIAKNVEAMGGKEKLSSLKSVRMTGSMTVQGTDVSITLTKAQLKGMRMDMSIMGTENYQVANMTSGSMFMPIMGMKEPKEMEAEQVKAFKTQMDVQGTLFNYKEKGSSVVLVGNDKIDGDEVYNLKVTFSNGKSANYFIDKKTSRLVKTSTTATAQGQETTVEATFSNYKQNSDGYWFPYTIGSAQGTINFEKVETNIPIDDKMFES